MTKSGPKELEAYHQQVLARGNRKMAATDFDTESSTQRQRRQGLQEWALALAHRTGDHASSTGKAHTRTALGSWHIAREAAGGTGRSYCEVRLLNRRGNRLARLLCSHRAHEIAHSWSMRWRRRRRNQFSLCPLPRPGKVCMGRTSDSSLSDWGLDSLEPISGSCAKGKVMQTNTAKANKRLTMPRVPCTLAGPQKYGNPYCDVRSGPQKMLSLALRSIYEVCTDGVDYTTELRGKDLASCCARDSMQNSPTSVEAANNAAKGSSKAKPHSG